jgi:GntR family transcriptional regulator
MTSTRYGLVTEWLRQAIAVGDTGPGGVLPTEAELCARYAASRSTIRRALVKLREEGLVESRQGSGWTVTPQHRGPPAPRYRVRSAAAARDAGDRTSPPIDHMTVGHHRRRPPSDIAVALRTDRSTPLLMVERITRLDGAAIHRTEVWFNRDYSARLDPIAAREHPPARLLAQHGQAFGRFDQYVEAVAANRRDHQLIGLQVGKPVLQVIRTAYDPDGTALFRSRHRHPGHNTEIEIWLPTTDQTSGPQVTIDAGW